MAILWLLFGGSYFLEWFTILPAVLKDSKFFTSSLTLIFMVLPFILVIIAILGVLVLRAHSTPSWSQQCYGDQQNCYVYTGADELGPDQASLRSKTPQGILEFSWWSAERNENRAGTALSVNSAGTDSGRRNKKYKTTELQES